MNDPMIFNGHDKDDGDVGPEPMPIWAKVAGFLAVFIVTVLVITFAIWAIVMLWTDILRQV